MIWNYKRRKADNIFRIGKYCIVLVDIQNSWGQGLETREIKQKTFI